jgi:hypothetical protein
MSKVRYEIRVKTGERDGKAFYATIGRVIQSNKGFSLKLDMIPIGFDGWAFLNEPKPKDDKQESSQRAADIDSDIPW